MGLCCCLARELFWRLRLFVRPLWRLSISVITQIIFLTSTTQMRTPSFHIILRAPLTHLTAGAAVCSCILLALTVKKIKNTQTAPFTSSTLRQGNLLLIKRHSNWSLLFSTSLRHHHLLSEVTAPWAQTSGTYPTQKEINKTQVWSVGSKRLRNLKFLKFRPMFTNT